MGNYLENWRQSPVDGVWRRWTMMPASRLGIISAEEIDNGVRDYLIAVCVETSRERPHV